MTIWATPKSATTRSAAVRFTRRAPSSSTSPSNPARFTPPDAWKDLVSNVKDNGATLHFLGLLSDGNVHSNISHLIAMLKEAKKEGVKRVRCHILLDGRDVPATSALEYVQQLEDVLASLNDADFDGRIASGGGRMKITMDRYQANWPMVERGLEHPCAWRGPPVRHREGSR